MSQVLDDHMRQREKIADDIVEAIVAHEESLIAKLDQVIAEMRRHRPLDEKEPEMSNNLPDLPPETRAAIEKGARRQRPEDRDPRKCARCTCRLRPCDDLAYHDDGDWHDWSCPGCGLVVELCCEKVWSQRARP